MYERITGENPYEVPMRIYPAIHYTMGGLWVDYNLMTTVPGLYAIGEANFSDHGANRLGASALMQGLADGYFIIPYTIGDYLAGTKLEKIDANHAAVRDAESRCCGTDEPSAGDQGQTNRHVVPSRTGQTAVGRLRHGPKRGGLKKALQTHSGASRRILEERQCSRQRRRANQALENAGRVADFLEFGELMCLDALHRNESCGGHFREEFQTPDGEALRNDAELFIRRGLGVRGPERSSPSSTRNR